MKKKFIKSRRAKPGSKPTRSVRHEDPWDKLSREIEAEEAAAKSSIATPHKKSGSIKPKKKGSRKPADVNSAVEKIFKEKSASLSKKVKKSKRSQPVDYGSTLKACKTVSEAAGLLSKTHERFTSKAQGAVGRRVISDESRTMLEGLLTKSEATSVCIMTNPRPFHFETVLASQYAAHATINSRRFSKARPRR